VRGRPNGGVGVVSQITLRRSGFALHLRPGENQGGGAVGLQQTEGTLHIHHRSDQKHRGGAVEWIVTLPKFQIWKIKRIVWKGREFLVCLGSSEVTLILIFFVGRFTCCIGCLRENFR
jgi:hypothetical protein